MTKTDFFFLPSQTILVHEFNYHHRMSISENSDSIWKISSRGGKKRSFSLFLSVAHWISSPPLRF
jgi:hypothetical protein